MSHWALNTPQAQRLLEQVRDATPGDWLRLYRRAHHNGDPLSHARARQRILLWAGDHLSESVRYACANRLPADVDPTVRSTVTVAITAILLSEVVCGDDPGFRDDVTIATADWGDVFAPTGHSHLDAPQTHHHPIAPTPEAPSFEVEQMNPPVRATRHGQPSTSDPVATALQEWRRQRQERESRHPQPTTFTHSLRIARMWIQQSEQPVTEFTRLTLGMLTFLTTLDQPRNSRSPGAVNATTQRLFADLDSPDVFTGGKREGTRIPRSGSDTRTLGTLLLTVESTADAQVSHHHDITAFDVFQRVTRLPDRQRAILHEELSRVLDHLIEAPSNSRALESIQEAPIAHDEEPTTHAAPRSTSRARENSLDLDGARRVLAELDALPGLGSVTGVLHQQVATVVVDRERAARGLATTSHSHHLVFTGPPGTGKTTVARHVGELYRELGLLSRGHTVEVDRAALVGEYLGSTTKKTVAALERASGGVLFIDEAYALIEPGYSRGDAFGREALNTVVKHMEDHRGDLVVILAGYDEPMGQFLRANPGLVSRIAITVPFPSYTPHQLGEILDHTVHQRGLRLDPAGRQVAQGLFDRIADSDDFGNARGVRNLVDAAQRAQAWRLCDRVGLASDDDLMTLTQVDIHRAEPHLLPAEQHVQHSMSPHVPVGAYL